MKIFKLILFALVMFAITNANAQTVDVKFDANDTYRSAYALAGDTINGAESLSKVFKVNKPYKYSFTMQMAADTTATDSTCVFTSLGSIDGVNYTVISTVNWHMTADTVVLLTGSNVGWLYLKGTLTSKGSGARISLGRTYLQLFQ